MPTSTTFSSEPPANGIGRYPIASSAWTNDSGIWPFVALRKNRPTAGWPHRASANAVSRSQRGRSSGSGRRWKRAVPRVASMFSPSTSRNVRRSPTSAAGDGGQDDDLVAVGNRCLEAAEEADVLVVDVDVDEAAQVHGAVLGLDEPVLDAGVVRLEVVDQGAQAGTAGLDGLLVAGVGAQDGGDPDLNGHRCLLDWSRVGRTRRLAPAGSPRPRSPP